MNNILIQKDTYKLNYKTKNRIHKIFPYLIIVIIAVCILWPQISNNAYISSMDYYFHMSRTYEAMMQIKTGHFSYFLSLFSWQHNFRIINAVYGPIWAYISGLILLLVKSWSHWEICVSLLTLIIAGSTMFHLGRYWHLNNLVNLLISILYMLSQPISSWVLNQALTGFGAALVPLIILMGSEALHDKDISPIKLALTIVLIIEIHMMTFILSMLFLIPCLLISLLVAHNNRKKLFQHLCESAALTIVLSFNAWGSILEVVSSNYHHIIPTYPGTHLGNEPYSAILNTYPKTSLLQSPSLIGMGIAILIVITIILWISNVKTWNYIIDIFMLLGIGFVWISSEWFPWKLVKRHMYKIATLIQFPSRFLPLGLVIIYLLAGFFLSKILNKNPKFRVSHVIILFLLLVITGNCWISDNTQNNYWEHNNGSFKYDFRTFKSSKVIGWTNMYRQIKFNPHQLRNGLNNHHPNQFLNMVINPVPDYLPTSETYTNPRQYKALNPYHRYLSTYKYHNYHNYQSNSIIIKHHNNMVIIKSSKPQVKTLPFVKYAHTQISINHQKVNPKINKIGAISLPLKAGTNKLTFKYKPALWFKLGVILSILAWLILIYGTLQV